MNAEWRSFNSPFDQYLLGDKTAFEQFSLKQVHLPTHPQLSKEDGYILQDRRESRQMLCANVLTKQNLSDDEVLALVSFLESLTDKTALPGRLEKPNRVPSGLPVE